MTLLDRIIAAAEGHTIPSSSLLRMMKTLAVRTGARDLRVWVDRELNGYPGGVPVPDYRGPIEMSINATFYNEYGGNYPNVPLDKFRIPERWHALLFEHVLRDPIAEIEECASRGQPSLLAWTADAVLKYNLAVERGEVTSVMNPGWQMSTAQVSVPASIYVGIIDRVRSAAHNLALELEQSIPSAGEPDTSLEIKEQAGTVINNVFNFGNSDLSQSNNAFGSSGVHQNIGSTIRGNVEHLEQSLRDAGVDDAAIDRLRDAIEADPTSPEAEPGSQVRAWLSAQTAGVAPAVVTLATQALFLFYGLPVVGG